MRETTDQINSEYGLFSRGVYLMRDIAHNSTKFIIFSKFILHILSLNIFHASELCSVSKYPSDFLRLQYCPKLNEVSLKFRFCKVASNIYKIVSAILQKFFHFSFIIKNRFSPQFLVSASTKIFTT